MDQFEFVRNAISLIGQPYSETDCIGVVRKAAHIQCQGTNWLWRSTNNSSKYRYLPVRKTGTLASDEYEDGLLLFRINFSAIPKGYSDTPDCYHVGVLAHYPDGWKIIQSNQGGVNASTFKPEQWQGWGKLKQVTYAGPQHVPTPEPMMTDRELLEENNKLLREILMKLG